MSFKKFLVPVEATQASDVAINAACALAQSLKAGVVLLHVYDVAHGGLTGGAFYPGRVNLAVAESAVAHIREKLDRRVAELRAHGVEAEGRVERGIPAAEILDAASTTGADLIVLSRRGAGRGVAKRVLEKSPIPVLVINAGRAEEVADEVSEHNHAPLPIPESGGGGRSDPE